MRLGAAWRLFSPKNSTQNGKIRIESARNRSRRAGAGVLRSPGLVLRGTLEGGIGKNPTERVSFPGARVLALDPMPLQFLGSHNAATTQPKHRSNTAPTQLRHRPQDPSPGSARSAQGSRIPSRDFRRGQRGGRCGSRKGRAWLGCSTRRSPDPYRRPSFLYSGAKCARVESGNGTGVPISWAPQTN